MHCVQVRDPIEGRLAAPHRWVSDPVVGKRAVPSGVGEEPGFLQNLLMISQQNLFVRTNLDHFEALLFFCFLSLLFFVQNFFIKGNHLLSFSSISFNSYTRC